MKRILATCLMALFLTIGCDVADSPAVPTSRDSQESQALSKQVKELTQEINEISATNAAVPARRDSQESQALSKQVKELTREINEISATNAALAQEIRKLSEANPAQAEPAGQGICGRTPVVQKAIIERLKIPSCSFITQGEMFRIKGRMSITLDYPLRPNDFAGMSNLGILRLAWNCNRNQGELLPAGVFHGLENLHWLQIDPSNCGTEENATLRPGVFKGLTSLHKLDLGDNDLTSVPPGLFDGLTSLHTLDLSGNDLTTLPPGLFEGLTGLHTLGLGGNDLTSVPPGLFDRLTSLHTLDLSGNDLTSLPTGIFTGLTSLRQLELNGKRDPVSGNSRPFEIEVANFGVAANLEGHGFVIVDKQQ